MTKSRIRRTGNSRTVDGCGGYQASVAWVTRPGTGMPNCHSERHAGRSDGSGRRRHVLPREVSSSVQGIGLPHGQPGGRELEKSAEAIVARAALWLNAKGRIFRCREQSGRFDGLYRPKIALPRRGGGATVRRQGGTDLPHSRRLSQLTASTQQRALAQHLCASTILKKPPYTASTYGGVGGRGREAPPTRSGSFQGRAPRSTPPLASPSVLSVSKLQGKADLPVPRR
jgi:hypothetical protein